MVVYGNDGNFLPGGNRSANEEGATVRERQRIFSLPDTGRLRVGLRVHESMVDRVAPGQRAWVRVDASAGGPLGGTVESIRPLPTRGNPFSSEADGYATLVAIDDPPAGPRPGMSARVEILLGRYDDVLAVPVEAVLQYRGNQRSGLGRRGQIPSPLAPRPSARYAEDTHRDAAGRRRRPSWWRS